MALLTRNELATWVWKEGKGMHMAHVYQVFLAFWLQSIIKCNGYSVVPGRLQEVSSTLLQVYCCESVPKE